MEFATKRQRSSGVDGGYPSPFVNTSGYGDGYPPYSVKELFIIQFSSDIRSKSNWHEKMQNGEIVQKWREEMQSFLERELGEPSIDAIDYVIDELVKYANLKNIYGPLEVAIMETMWKSDALIDENLKQELIENLTKRLETEGPEDWHPVLNHQPRPRGGLGGMFRARDNPPPPVPVVSEEEKKQVLDLIHPSLFPVVYGRTQKLSTERVQDLVGDEGFLLKFIGEGEVISPPEPATRNVQAGRHTIAYRAPPREYLSQKYQWLPSEFFVDGDGDAAILSYINNLHPIDYAVGYNTIGKIFSKFVPLFERVLTDLKGDKYQHRRIHVGDWYASEEMDDIDEDDFEDHRTIHQPQAPRFQEEPESYLFGDSVSFKNQTLKVIVKMSNIHLTPESPEYRGGSWHVEGMENESIVATGIYYYDVENITESKLKFRVAVAEPDYEQGDDRGVEAVYRLRNEEPLNQVLGEIKIYENLCVAFPNIFQHQVSPFSLQDRNKPGHRKILVFFLVDPTKAQNVHSSRILPPQNSSWLVRELKNVGFMNLLSEVELELISDYLEWPMSWNEALNYRLDLMQERSTKTDIHNENYFERDFSLCEH
jgi:hypothetical protein